MTAINAELIDALMAGKATPDQQTQAAQFILEILTGIGKAHELVSDVVQNTEEKFVQFKERLAAAEREQEMRESEREAREKAVAATINSILHPNRSS